MLTTQVLSAQNVKHGVLSYETDRFTTEQEFHAFNARLGLKEGDFLLTIVGTIGRAAIMTEVRPLVFQRSVAIIRPRESVVNSRFLFHASQTQRFQSQLATSSNTSSQAGIYLGKLKEVTIPLPPLAEQRRIAEVLDRAEALRAKRSAALAQLDALNQSLFLDLFGDPATNPKAWMVIQLGGVIFSVSDGPHVSPNYVDSGIPFLSTRHVRPGGMSWEDLKFISLEDAQIHWKKCKPERGDILYTKGGTTGIAKVVDFDEPVAIWVHIALLKTDRSKVEPLWLEAMLNTQFCYQQSQTLTRGIANRDLGLTRMVNIKMYLPPLDLQREFARRVAAVERLKSSQRAALAELDALFAALQHRAFRGEL